MDAFELFWRNSNLTPASLRPFATRVQSYVASERPRVCTFAAPDVALARPDDRLARLVDRRRSVRSFAPGALSVRQLGRLLAAVSARPDGGRSYPSAGALYPLEVFCLTGEVTGGLGHSVLCYNPDDHSVTPVGPLAPWPDWSDAINLVTDGAPQVVLAFVLFVDQVLEKYGDLGGRLALIEVGHAAQNLALRLAADGLVGCEAGGVVEPTLLSLLHLDGTEARVALAYACGTP